MAEVKSDSKELKYTSAPSDGASSSSSSSNAMQLSGDDDWQNPNKAAFQGNTDLAWRYFENIVPKRDFGVRVNEDGKYPELFHLGHPRASLRVITCFAKTRYAETGMGNSVLNPANNRKTGKSRNMLKPEDKSHLAEVSVQLTRWPFDAHLKDAQGRNPTFMRLTEFREECQRWTAWWLWTNNSVPDYIGDVKKVMLAKASFEITAGAGGEKKSVTRRFERKEIDGPTRDKEFVQIEEEMKKQLAELTKAIDKVDPEEAAEVYRGEKMHQTYAFKLDNDKGDGGSDVGARRPDGTFLKKQRMAGKVDERPILGKKPATEHVGFKRKVFRTPYPNQFKDAPYVAPSAAASKVWEELGMYYNGPRFYQVADMGRTPAAVAAGGAKEFKDAKEAEEYQRKQEEAADRAARINAYNRAIPDGAVIAVSYSMGIYYRMDAQGKSGISDEWQETFWLQGPTDEDVQRHKKWQVGNVGAKVEGLNLQAMKPVKGAQPYRGDEEWAAPMTDLDDDALLKLGAAMAAERKKREDAKAKAAAEAEAKAEGKEGKSKDKEKEKVQDGDSSSANGGFMPASELLPVMTEDHKKQLADQRRHDRRKGGAKRNYDQVAGSGAAE